MLLHETDVIMQYCNVYAGYPTAYILSDKSTLLSSLWFNGTLHPFNIYISL